MAVSKTLTQTGSKGHHKFTLTVTETATSTENNTSTISIVFKLSPVSTGWDWENHSSVKGTVTVAGTEYSWTCPTYNGSSTVTLVSKTKTITHGSDGSKSISLAFRCTSDTSYAYLPGTASASGTLTLTTIPRESTLAVSTPRTLGSAVTLTVTRHTNSFTHTITAKCGSASAVTVVTKSSSLSPSYTLPLGWASQNTTGTSVSVTFTITTYNGSTKVGSAKSVTVSASMPTSVKPAVSALAVAAGDTASAGHLSRYGGYVQGKSKVKLTATASQSYSSALKTYTFTCSEKTYTATENNVTTSALSVTGSITATAKVTDARGRTSTETSSTSFTVWPYASPSLSLEVHRCDSTGAESMTGAYCRVDWEGTIASLNNANVGSVKVRYKKSTEENYTEVTGQPISSEDLQSPFTFAADDDSTYDVVLLITDDFVTVSVSAKLSTASVPMHFGPAGDTIAIGKLAQNDRQGLDVGWDIWVKDVDMTIQDNEYTQLAPTPASGTPKRLFSILKNIFKRNSPASGGTVLSMVNTGDMYTWNNKASTSVASASANGLMSSADKSKLNAVGDIGGAINGSTSIANKSVPGDSTITELGSFTLSKGVWVVKIQVRFNANANGNRTIYLSTTSGGDALSVWNTNKVPASPTNYTHVPLITFLRVDVDSATYHITSQQNSGSAITAAIRWGAIRISD